MKPTCAEVLSSPDTHEGNAQLGIWWFEALGYIDITKMESSAHDDYLMYLPACECCASRGNSVFMRNPATDANAAREVLVEIERRGLKGEYLSKLLDVFYPPGHQEYYSDDSVYARCKATPRQIVMAALLAVLESEVKKI